MSSPIKPLGERVVATPEAAETKTASGLYLPDNAQKKPVVAKVVAVGPDVKSVKTGDRVLYKDFSATEVKIGSTDYLIINQEDILATV